MFYQRGLVYSEWLDDLSIYCPVNFVVCVGLPLEFDAVVLHQFWDSRSFLDAGFVVAVDRFSCDL